MRSMLLKFEGANQYSTCNKLSAQMESMLGEIATMRNEVTALRNENMSIRNENAGFRAELQLLKEKNSA